MNHKPLDLATARLALWRMKHAAPKSKLKMVGGNGSYYIHETRHIRGTNGILGTLVVVHGRDIGRACQRSMMPKQTVHSIPRVLA